MKANFSSHTWLGLALSLALPLIYVLWIAPTFIQPALGELASTLVGFAVLWLLALAVVLYVLKVEKRSLTSIGWQPFNWRSALLAIGLGLLLSLLVPVLTLLVGRLFPSTEEGSISQVVSSFPWWVILLSVLTAGITEEILFRAYPLSRLLEASWAKWLAGAFSLAFFVCLHSSGWNLAHMVGVVLPLGLILTGLFLWKRNLWFVILVHVMIDLPLVFFALAG